MRIFYKLVKISLIASLLSYVLFVLIFAAAALLVESLFLQIIAGIVLITAPISMSFFWGSMIYDCVVTIENRKKMALWLLLIIFTNFTGSLIYYFVKKRYRYVPAGEVTVEEKQDINWWDKNWKWFVPAGCLTIVLIFFIFIGALFVGISSIMKGMNVYKYPMKLVNQNEGITELLGSPIESTFMMQGDVSTKGDSGIADLLIPVKGPKGTGTIYVSAEKNLGQWEYITLEIKIKSTSERINLIE
ncbi:MAG: PLDc N-terminal domain-containing protein [Candidatus Aureabacteria bacterium]|nr:PLDc N-terminal domain-containing protein [Candidatus Auribacterota bacterium]